MTSRSAADVELPIRKTVWMYWAQGWDEAPPLVRECADSWAALNPDWTVELLDAGSVAAWLDVAIPNAAWERMGPAHRAAHVRLELLARYGGVWADATLLAFRPLAAWLPDLLPSGFFAFRWLPGDRVYSPATGRWRRTGRSRRMASWFLAAAAGNYLVRALSDAYTDYWTRALPAGDPPPGGRAALAVRRVAGKALAGLAAVHPALASLWVRPVVAEVLRVRPYLVVNAVFTHLVQTDRRARAVWEATPAVSAVTAHRLYEVGLEPTRTQAWLADGAARDWVVQKVDRGMPLDAGVARALRAVRVDPGPQRTSDADSRP